MKLIRMSTVGLSLDVFCRGLLNELKAEGYDVTALSSPDAELTRLGEREGVRTVGVRMRRDISPLSDLVSLVRLIRVMRREKPDIIHTLTPKAGLLGMLAACIARVPVRVHTFTGLLFPTATGLRRLLLMTTDRITCMAATHIVPEGEGVRNDLLSAGITRKPMRVLGHGNIRGIDLDHYRPTERIEAEALNLRHRLGIAPNARVLTFVGRFVKDKGLRELIAAIRGLDCELVLVGAPEGGPNDIPDTLLHSSSRIHLSGGWVDDTRPWLAMADALVFPSYREGFPNVVLEAGAMGKPSIVTDINGSREIIADGVNGLVVPPRDTDALRGAIERFLTMPATEKARMGQAARENVEKKFSQTYVRACLKEYYREITCSPHS